MPNTIRVGMEQIRVEAGQSAANLRRAVAMIAQAGQAGCDRIVLPEYLDLGWTDRRARELACIWRIAFYREHRSSSPKASSTR